MSVENETVFLGCGSGSGHDIIWTHNGKSKEGDVFFHGGGKADENSNNRTTAESRRNKNILRRGLKGRYVRIIVTDRGERKRKENDN